MCGIAGVIHGGRDADSQARALIEPLQHRGPDGVRVERAGEAVLAHARLSIIDLECGWQPLTAAGSTVIGNGEIYNYKELIEEFQLHDQLKTGSDFEPLLHLYAHEGERAFERLRGMYAFCLVGHDGRTWLVRDPFGIKPLYAGVGADPDPNGDWIFASEIRSMLARPLAPPTDLLSPERVAETLALGYAVGRYSVWYETERARPGAVLEVTGGWIRPSPSRLQAIPPAAPPPASEHEALAALDRVLEDSVRVHQRSDVPYGLFLSGGIDSAAIATLMARLNERPVTAYTCGFDAPGARDERAAAERVARALDLDWRETRFGEEDFWRVLPEVAWALDDPTTDYATLPTYKLAEAARGTLTVVLTGEGGDELFGGYGRYRRSLRPRLLGGRPAQPQIDAPFLQDGGADALEHWREEAQPPVGLTRLQQAQYADIVTWLPNDLLLKLDRCLMAHGLEGRTPFLDREVAAFAFHLPDRMKIRGRYGKWILRKWLERHCPAAEPWAKKKGFTVPVAAWIAPRAADLATTIGRHEGLAQVCDMERVRAVFTDDSQAHNRWPLLFYAVWWNIHVAGMSRHEAAAAAGAAA
ncbi:MAG TPA: asparagine synthase (glutamine-hydrolyzing) [Caulobacteraceae bacterium]|jgi:asparagine synthase (glutamine-hydrolysing)